MKPIYKFLSMAMLFVVVVTFASCEGEKDLVIIEGNLPIKTETLYMVGDAVPAGWNIDAPTAFTPSQEDPLVFSYEGHLSTGDLRCAWRAGTREGVYV